jgi:hypothetical protein
VADTISDAVKSSDIIFMCLGDDAAVNSTVDSMLENDVEGKLIVDCSTVHPDTTNALEKKVIEKGGEFVGMPGKPIHQEREKLMLTSFSIRRPSHGRQRAARLRDCRKEGVLRKGDSIYDRRHGPREHRLQRPSKLFISHPNVIHTLTVVSPAGWQCDKVKGDRQHIHPKHGFSAQRRACFG